MFWKVSTLLIIYLGLLRAIDVSPPSEQDLLFEHEVCPNPSIGKDSSKITLETFDATRNGGKSYVTVMMSVFSGCNPGRVDVPAFAESARRMSAVTDQVAFLVSAKGGGSCKAWMQLTNQTVEYPLVIQDDDRRLHYMFFDYHPQFVILDKHMKPRYKFGSKELSKLPEYTLELLREPDVNVWTGDAPRVSAWSEWSACSERCGAGTTVRTREVLATGAGNEPLPSLEESTSCYEKACDVVYPKKVCADLFGMSGKVKTIATHSDDSPLHKPTDLKFHPQNKNELWVSNAETDSFTILRLGARYQMKRAKMLRDRHPYHYMDQISSFSFDDMSSYLATCQLSANTYDDRMEANNFQGPTLYDTDPKWLVNHMNEHARCGSDGLYGIDAAEQSSECYLSHHDMLHEAPECAGIVHDPELRTPFKHVYWAFAGQDGHLVRFDFEQPHYPGSMDHALAAVRRYTDVQLSVDPALPGHMAIDPDFRQMFIADTGAGRVLVVDLDSSQYKRDAREEYPVFSSQEPTFEYSLWGCTVSSDFATELKRPTGVVVTPTTVYVAEHDTGHIHAYIKKTGEHIQTFDTKLGGGLTSLTLSPDKNTLFYSHTGVESGTPTVGYVKVIAECRPGRAASEILPNDFYFGGREVTTPETELCLSEASEVGLTPVFEHDPGYMNMSGITDEYTNADCDTVNYDAILLNGYFCHKCLRNPCDNGAECVDHRYVGFTCNCSSVDAEEDMQYTGDKCQIKKPCNAFSMLSCEELGHATQATEYGDPHVCGFAKNPRSGSVLPRNMNSGKCFKKQTFTDAKETCAGLGARLCTAEELQFNEAMGSDCAGDDARVWTQHSCKQGTRGKSIGGSRDVGKKMKTQRCEQESVKRHVRCCADTVASTC